MGKLLWVEIDIDTDTVAVIGRVEHLQCRTPGAQQLTAAQVELESRGAQRSTWPFSEALCSGASRCGQRFSSSNGRPSTSQQQKIKAGVPEGRPMAKILQIDPGASRATNMTNRDRLGEFRHILAACQSA